MEQEREIKAVGRFPLQCAYKFLSEKGHPLKSDEIKESKESRKSCTSSFRRAKILNFMESFQILDKFIQD